MQLLIHILLTVLIVILSILLLVLMIPIVYRFSLSYSSEQGFKVQVRLWKIFSFRTEKTEEKWQSVIGIAGKNFTPRPRKPKGPSLLKKRKAKQASKNSRPPIGKTLPLLTDKAFWQQSLSLLKDVLKLLRPHYFRMEGRVGFDEPHYTAWALALGASLNGICKQQIINLEPVWEEETVDIRISFGGCFMIFMILIRLLVYLFSKEVRSWRKQWKAAKQAT